MAEDITRRDALAGWTMTPIAGQTWTLDDLQPKGITFAPGIFIDTKTGNVTLPEGLSLNDASKAFWDAVQIAFPQMCAAKKTGR